MSDEIIKVIDAIAEKFGIMIDWTAENVMPLITETLEQLIRYKQITYGIWIAILITIALMVWNGFNRVDKKWYKHCLEHQYANDWWYYSNMQVPLSTEDRDFCIGLKWTTVIIISIIVLFILNGFIKLLFAPNVYILEYLQSML